MSWHPDRVVLDRYAEGTVGDVLAASVEAHVVTCPSCGAALTDSVAAGRRERIWAGVSEVAEAPTTRRIERPLRWLGFPEATARLLAMTPAVRPSWVLSVTLVLATAVVFGPELGEGSAAFVLLGPLVPVVGVAASFGRRVDPVYGVGLATATGGFRLLLVRVTAVVATSALVVAVAALVANELLWSVLWLLPALCVTLLTLVLSTWVSPWAASGLVSMGWVTAVSAVVAGPMPDAVFLLSGQLLLALLAGVLLVVLAARRQAFESL